MRTGERALSRRAVVSTLAAAPLAACVTGKRAAPAPATLATLELVADGLRRPEGVVALRDGRVIVSQQNAACTIIEPGGARRSVGAAHAPNGIAMDRRGGVIVANYGLMSGAPGDLQRVDLATGETTILASAIGGRALVASNAPAIGPGDEIYCTHTHWDQPANIGNTQGEGFVYKVAADGACTLVCGGVRGANGLCFSPDFSRMYVARTAAGDVMEYRRDAKGGYGAPARFGPMLGAAPDNITVAEIRALSAGARSKLGQPDGLALDADGNAWVTLPFANKVAVATRAGALIEIVSDPSGEKLNMPTNLAFGGPDLRTLYIASMANNSLWKMRVGVPGAPLPHWFAV